MKPFCCYVRMLRIPCAAYNLTTPTLDLMVISHSYCIHVLEGCSCSIDHRSTIMQALMFSKDGVRCSLVSNSVLSDKSYHC